MDDWPAWATEGVRLKPADPAWAERGAQLAAQLAGQLRGWLVGPVEHVGSTAVAGLLAKPVLDLQAAVRDLADASAIAPVLAPDGWHYTPAELDGHPYRRLFIQAVGDHRVAHLHLMVAGEQRLTDQLAFRDALRAEPELAASYAELKTRLAAEHAEDREAYSAAKADFVAQVLRR